MSRTLIVFVLILSTRLPLCAQYFQFSQYNFTSQRINPASTGASNFATASALFRNQSTGASFNLKSNILTLSYPLINRRNGFRWSGVGLSFMDDGTGQNGIYRSKEIALSYAVNIPVARFQTLSVGFKVLHANRRVDVAGLVTDSQYVPDRGFNTGMETGENPGILSNQFTTFSSGLYWQQEDKKGNRIATLGLSFFDLNKPEDNFLKGSNPYPSTLVLSGSARVAQRDKLAFVPDLLFTRNTGLNLATIGMVTSYQLASYRKLPDDRIDIIIRYTINRSGIIGLQMHRGNFSVGASYDFPVSNASAANSGAFEVAVEIRRLVDPKSRAKARKEISKKKSRKNSDDRNKNLVKRTTPQPGVKKVASDSAKSKPDLTSSAISQRLKHKQDSIQAIARPGDLSQEPLLLEETTLRFGFDFNSSEMDESSILYLNDLAEALTDNPDLRIELTGHTDNVGSAKFNMRLSLERAATIKDELLNRGVGEDRITVFGKGLTEPLNGNTTPEERALNRRVEMKIFYE